MYASRQQLNARQLEAASFGDHPLRVIAGPGTGKTTTLSARVEFLLERGVVPDRILLLTFTRRSAREIIGRVRRCGAASRFDESPAAPSTPSPTAPCAAIRRAGLPDGFGVLDQGDGADLLDLVRSDLGILSSDRRLPKKSTLAGLYSRTVNTGVPWRR